MLPYLFARRYLFSPHSRSVVNLISGLSVAAIAMPVAAMIILLSVFNGFEALVRSMYSAFDAHLTVTPRQGQTFAVSELDTAALRRIGRAGGVADDGSAGGVGGVGGVGDIAALSYILEQSALLEHAGRQATATVRGVDDDYGEVFALGDAVTSGEWRVRLGDLDRLVIGQSMAYMLGIRSLADADVSVYAVRRGRFSSLLPLENYSRRTVPVGGAFSLDLETEKQYVLAPLRLAQELFDYPGRASSLVLRLSPGVDPIPAKKAVEAVVGAGFQVRTRDELRASFYRIMTYEKWGIFFIALLVLLIASFSVVGALSMLVVEKRGDIDTLAALGADRSLLRAIFRCEGYLICALGALCGVVLGVGASLAQQHLGLIEIPAETFLTKSYPVQFRLSDLWAVLCAFVPVATALCSLTVRSMIKNNTCHV